MNIRFWIGLAILFLWLACNSSAIDNQESAVNNVEEMGNDTIISSPTAQDTFAFDLNFYPADSQLTLEVLTLGAFHGEDVPNGADSQQWYGLFKSGDSFYIELTSLEFATFHDEIVDEKGDSTSVEITVANQDSCIMLISKMANLTERSLDTAWWERISIYPDDSLELNDGNQDYLFTATGEGKKPEKRGWYPVKNYKLYQKTIENGETVEHLLVAQPYFDDVFTEILFIGDIDGDGVLDYIIETSNKYSWSRPTLYLSSKSKSGKVAVPVGGHTQTGC